MRPSLHVARSADWERAKERGEYAVPPGRDPFTHACHPEQLAGVLDRFYAATPRAGLVLLEVDPAGLPVEVEADGDGAGDFWHAYGPIPGASVTVTRPVG